MLISLAPMDGITDTAYRILCKQIFEKQGNKDDTLGLWTEFMSAEGYTHNPRGVVKHLLTLQSDESKTIAQIFGGKSKSLIQCAKEIDQKYGFQGVELNMGCPSPKIMKCAAGSGMLRDKEKSLQIIKEIAESISIPLSLKTRIGLKQDDIKKQFDFLIKASQYVNLIAVHGRTYSQGHSGDVSRDFLYTLKKELPTKIIIGNGGIRSYQQASQHLSNLIGSEKDVLLDGIMIGQSAIGNPRILTPHTPSHTEKIQTILAHLDLSVACEIYFKQTIKSYQKYDKLIQPTMLHLQEIIKNIKPSTSLSYELKSPIEFRKYLFNYIKGLPESKRLKQSIIKIRDYHTLKTILQEYFNTIE